jgi:crotonobetainyl-CoA:carnitine CoA-transferase CaiB-like acyl-CoA transferase
MPEAYKDAGEVVDVMERAGNAERDMAPHGVYPAAGDDRWVAIAVAADAQWTALCDVIGHAELARDERYATAGARLARRDELDTLVGEWTRNRPERESETALQARGIAAYAVQDSAAMFSDPQLQHRGHFVRLDDGAGGTQTVEGSRFKLSRTPAKVERPAPTFGRDNFYVLETILGYDADRIGELAAAGFLE